MLDHPPDGPDRPRRNSPPGRRGARRGWFPLACALRLAGAPGRSRTRSRTSSPDWPPSASTVERAGFEAARTPAQRGAAGRDHSLPTTPDRRPPTGFFARGCRGGRRRGCSTTISAGRRLDGAGNTHAADPPCRPRWPRPSIRPSVALRLPRTAWVRSRKKHLPGRVGLLAATASLAAGPQGASRPEEQP